MTFFVSCGDEETSSGKNYQVPRFAVYPLANTGVPGQGSFASNLTSPLPESGLRYLVLAPLNALFPSAYAQENECAREQAFLNDAPQLFGNAGSISDRDLIHQFYAQAIFYDCVTRQQALRHGVGETVQNDSDNENQEVVVLTASHIGENPEELTEFVSWTDLPESENVRGRLVNKYVQDNGIITKTRVDLEIVDGARKVTSMLHFIDPNNSSIKFYSKAGFQELMPDGDGNFQQHEIWGRFHDNSGGSTELVQVKAVSRVGSGVSIELERCDVTSNVDTDDCTGSGTVTHYDANGSSASDAGGRSFGNNSGDSFYGGQGEEDFFTPEFSIE